MKIGTTSIVLVKLEVDVTKVSKIIWTLKSDNTTITKNYPNDVTYADGYFGLPLTQENTTALGEGIVRVEGQVNYSDKAVAKTETISFRILPTLATEVVTGNAPTGGIEPEELKVKISGDVIIAQAETGGGTWGSITGTLSDQTDLKSALDSKANTNQIPSLNGYATESYVTNAISDKADKSEIPSLTGYATQNWVQNQGYTTSEIDDNTTGVTNTWSASKINQNLSDYNKTNNFKTINNESIIGTGNIEVSGDNGKFKDFVEERMLYNQQIQHTSIVPYYSSYPQNEGVITLGIDDCVIDFPNIVQCYIEANIPVCVAYIGNKNTSFSNIDTTFWGSSSVTVKEVIDRLVQNGGEVLCHHGEVLTQEKLEDFDTCFEHFVACKKRYEQDGNGNWDINGIILAGGTGQVAGSPISDKWVRSNFLYSDIYGMATYKEPYYHYRSNMSNFTLDTLKADILNTVSLGRWDIRYQHSFSEFSKENLQALLSWINAQNITVKTYKQVYDDLITYKIPKYDLSNYYTKAEVDALISGGGETWDETIDFTFTDGRDQRFSSTTANWVAGKTYELSFEYKVDATNCSANGITLYNWSQGLDSGISFSAHGINTGTKTITVTSVQSRTNASVIQLDDKNQQGAENGSLVLYLKNITFTEVS